VEAMFKLGQRKASVMSSFNRREVPIGQGPCAVGMRLFGRMHRSKTAVPGCNHRHLVENHRRGTCQARRIFAAPLHRNFVPRLIVWLLSV
jgi:hypothetical protein